MPPESGKVSLSQPSLPFQILINFNFAEESFLQKQIELPSDFRAISKKIHANSFDLSTNGRMNVLSSFF